MPSRFSPVLKSEQNLRRNGYHYSKYNTREIDYRRASCRIAKPIDMEQVIRQCVGIDCANDDLATAFNIMNADFGSRTLANKKFDNHKEGFKALLSWSRKLRKEGLELYFAIEATGVYHESISLFLYQNGENVSVILPNRIKHFAGTENVKTINDKVSAQIIAQFGLEKKLDLWQPPHEVYNQLRQLTRERDQLNQELTLVKNQLHAEQAGAWPNTQSIKRTKQRIDLIDKQKLAIEKEIKTLINGNKELKAKIANICTIKGVGLLTAVIIIAETNGFNLIRNRRQLTSYAGLDVQEKDSGTSVHLKPRISKRGNKYLRKAVYFPALSAVRHDEKAKAGYARLVSKHGIKMKAAVAVQRRLLELVYTLWKTDQPYDPNYQNNKEIRAANEAALNEMA